MQWKSYISEEVITVQMVADSFSVFHIPCISESYKM
jgi:hypothetical protein